MRTPGIHCRANNAANSQPNSKPAHTTKIGGCPRFFPAVNAFLIMNGGFVYDATRWDTTSFANRLWGLAVDNHTIHSLSTYNGEVANPFPIDSQHKFIAQRDDGTYFIKSGKVEDEPGHGPTGTYGDSPFYSAHGGLFGPTRQDWESGAYDDSWNAHADTATLFLGTAPTQYEQDALVIGASRFGTITDYGRDLAGTEGFGRDAFASGASNLLFLDGGSSIAVAHRQSAQESWRFDLKGAKHRYLTIRAYYWLPVYIAFE